MKKVLVAEDNAENLMLFKALLDHGGFASVLCDCGRTSVEQAIREQPDLVLMDINLPDIDGITAMRSIREAEGLTQVPVIALTGHAMPGDRDRFLAAGFTDYVAKPIDVIQFLGLVKRYLSGAPEHTVASTE